MSIFFNEYLSKTFLGENIKAFENPIETARSSYKMALHHKAFLEPLYMFACTCCKPLSFYKFYGELL